MLYKKNIEGYKSLIAGVNFKTLVYGTNTSLHEFKLTKGSIIPKHSHMHEQTGYMISGKMMFVLKDGEFFSEPGDSWCIPGNVDHEVHVLEDSVVIEVFSPVRQEYLT
jgi:quercetin dioxygenase-like cupin family protein